MDIKPLGDRVLIKPAEAKEVSKGGIILPDTAQEKPQEGEIVAIGAGTLSDSGERVALEVKVGDKVLYGKYSGTEITYNDVSYMIMKESDILAII